MVVSPTRKRESPCDTILCCLDHSKRLSGSRRRVHLLLYQSSMCCTPNYSWNHVIGTPRGPRKLFELNEFRIIGVSLNLFATEGDRDFNSNYMGVRIYTIIIYSYLKRDMCVLIASAFSGFSTFNVRMFFLAGLCFSFTHMKSRL